jgi:hypothetical protein
MSILKTVLFTLQPNMFILLPLGGNNLDKGPGENTFRLRAKGRENKGVCRMRRQCAGPLRTYYASNERDDIHDFSLVASVPKHFVSSLTIRQLLRTEKKRFLEVKPSTLLLATYRTLTYIRSETRKWNRQARCNGEGCFVKVQNAVQKRIRFGSGVWLTKKIRTAHKRLLRSSLGIIVTCCKRKKM